MSHEITKKDKVDKETERIYYLDDKGVRIDSISITIPIKTDSKGRLIYDIADISSVKIKLVNSSFPTSIIMISAGMVLSIIGLPNRQIT
jgi:hypothetical protein